MTKCKPKVVSPKHKQKRTMDYELPDDGRFYELPERGHPPVHVQRIVMKRCSENMSDYLAGMPSGKPGTVNSPEAVEAFVTNMKYGNANLVDLKMFPGAGKIESDVISMTANMLNHPDHEKSGGFMLSGGTESINQALWMMKERYFRTNYDISVGESGLLEAVLSIRDKQPDYRPVILSPVNAHFAVAKCTDIQGLGKNSMRYYGLNDDFTTDLESLARTVETAYENGEEIVVNFCVAGDTEKGKVQDVKEIDRIVTEISKKYNRHNPPIVVDAAAQFVFLSMMKDSEKYCKDIPEWDFRVPNVAAVVCDWHKNRIPYNAGALVLRDNTDLMWTDQLAAYLHTNSDIEVDNLSEEEQAAAGAASTISTSRGAGGAFATWAYCLTQGIAGLKRSKEEVWRTTQLFADAIFNSRNYELLCDPQTSVVAFRLREDPERHEKIYNALNNNKDYNCFISHSDAARVKTVEEHEEYVALATAKRDETDEHVRAGIGQEIEDKYSGLHVHIMEHNTDQTIYPEPDESIKQTIEHLEELAEK